MRHVSDSVAERVAALVDRFGSDDKLASELGTTRQRVIAWRMGEAVPGRRNAERLAELEGTDVESWPYRGRRPPPTQPDEEAVALLVQMIREMRDVQDAEVASQEAAREAILRSLRSIEARLRQLGS